MTTTRYAIVRIESSRHGDIGTTEAAGICGVHPGLIERLVRLGLCEPVDWDPRNQEWVFEAAVVPRVRKILRLRRDLGINYAGIGVVLDLLARIERLEQMTRETE